MSNPVVLITGGLTGIGRAAAVAFAKKGAKVVVAGRRDEAGKALAKELRSFGSEAEFINADVRKEDDVRALVDKTVARYLRPGLAIILCFVACKMLLTGIVDISVATSLSVIVGIVLVAVAASWAFPKQEHAK